MSDENIRLPVLPAVNVHVHVHVVGHVVGDVGIIFICRYDTDTDFVA